MNESKNTSRTSKQSSSEPSLTKYQTFEPVTMRRSQLKQAPYNPRIISEHARKRLKKAIRELGIVDTVVWNKRTGHVVGGHQRLSILDDLERGRDYLLTVARIDVDEKTESKLNLVLNNWSAQGEWDTEKLEKIVLSLNGDLELTGFDPVEIQALCPTPDIESLFADEKDKMAKTAEELAAIKKRRKSEQAKTIGHNSAIDDGEFYVVLVAKDRNELDKFMELCQLDLGQRYHDIRKVADMIKHDETQ